MTATLDRYLDALEAGDGPTAVRLAVDELDGGTTFEQVMFDLVGAAQAEVGRRWEIGEWSVAREHRATAIAEDVLAVLASRPAPETEPRGRVALACVEGEWHSLPARITAHVLRRGGWQVSFLGPSVPADQLASFLHDDGPVAVAVSCVVPANLPGARRVVETAREAGTPVLAGGSGFGATDRWARTVGANQWVPNAMAARGALEALTPFTDPAPALNHGRIGEHRELAGRLTEVSGAAGRVWEGRDNNRVGDFTAWAVRSLSAALLVDDRSLFEDYIAWLRSAHRPVGVDEPDVDELLPAIADALGDGLPTAKQWVREAATR